jgi:hypothetical protein
METSKIIWRVNRTPRFSVLELGEYMAADDGPRETMLRNMRYERMAPSLMYRSLYRAISSYLTSPTRDRGILIGCKDELEQKLAEATNPQQRDNIKYELRAIEAFERSVNALGISGINFMRAPVGRRLQIEGVKVSVKPTAHIQVARPRGSPLLGVLLIDAAKGIELKTEEAKAKATAGMRYTAILLHQYATEEFADATGKIVPEQCILFHSYRQQRETAPSTYRRDFRNIQAVCRNISRGWAGIEPPPSFDRRFATSRA